MSETERKDAAGLSAVKDFSLPRYAELPNFGLYLEQALKAFFLQSTKSGGAEVEFDLSPVDSEGLFLNVRLEDLASLSLREGNIVTVHFAFAGDFADCH